AQKALIKQAGEKLSEAEIQQLSELLKTQFRNVFPTAAPNAAAAGGVSPLVVDFQPTPALPPPPPAASTTADAATATTPTTTSGVKRKAPQAPAVDKKDIAKSLPTPASATAANAKTKSAPPGVQGKMPILEMPDGSVYRADGTVVKADGSVMKAQGAQGFVFPVPPPPPTTSKKGEPTSTPPTAPSSGASPTSMPQKVNAATQAGGGSTTGPLKTPEAVNGVDLDTQTESNHDTALTLACAGGHEELVELLLQRGADIEHRDKKGFTPLILAATAGHVGVVETLLNHGACIEAQSERTKDTALSLACSGGRKEVVDLLLKRNANKEHRNVSDYTPLSLAASGGYVDIVISLLNAGAEINSRTGSKLGISPLMLAAMNGHTQATKVLLERGSDINAQIETNRNTALTLACFQGRNEVVKLLLDYHANVEHRAKTGLTPLMEAANGGYVEVGRLLLHYDADPNTSPVPTSRDTALTIGADKGHAKFVELLVHHGAQIDARNKKGCTPLWLACHGGHLETVQTLVKHCADVDAQDNRRVSPLMIAFRKGHVKVVKYMVRHVTQFPSDQECFRYIATITDKDLLAKCRQCMEVIVAAKDRQAAEANKAAETLLEELAKEEEQAMTKKLAKQRQKEKKKAKRQAKKVQPTPVNAGDDLDGDGDDDEPEKEQQQQINESNGRLESTDDKTRSRSSSISSPSPPPPPAPAPQDLSEDDYPSKGRKSTSSKKTLAPSKEDPAALVPRVPNMMPPDEPAPHPPSPTPLANSASGNRRLLQSQQQQQSDGEQNATSLKGRRGARRARNDAKATTTTTNGTKEAMKEQQLQQRDTEWSRAGVVRRRGAGQPRTREGHSQQHNQPAGKQPTTAQPQPLGAKDHPDDPYTAGWREVDTARRRSNKLTVSSSAIARVIGRGGQNINAIREATGAHIEVEKQQPKKEQQDRLITIRGSADATRHAVLMINGLIMDNDAPVADVIKKVRDKEQAAGQQAASQQQQRPPNQPTPTDAQNIAVSKKQGGGAFDVSVWSSSAGGDGRRMSIDQQPPLASSANSTTTVTASSSPAADYSPFATPNVWLQRAAKRQMQQGKRFLTRIIEVFRDAMDMRVLPQKLSFDPDALHFKSETQRLDFASVAAARPASNRQSPPSTSSGSTAIRDSQQPSAATMAEDQRKAPGYARPASATQQSPPNNNIGMTTPPVPTASLAALGQSKSALNTPSSNAAAFSTHSHLDNDSNSLMFAPIGLPLPASSLAS
uniref:K Homology domain-containing protein n=1 Tax=Plectus sambesii TaxID=2011161 RepID=A0A914WYR6_9BILA